MSIKENNAYVVSACTQRIVALNKYVKPKTPIKIERQQMKLSEILGIYQACIDTRAELVSQRAAYEKALAARDSAEVQRQAIEPGLKAWVSSEFGVSSVEAKELGFLPHKVAEKSVASKAAAHERNLATRAARHTMGKRQKKGIKGTTVVPAAPADPATTTSAATPATSVTTSTTVAPTSASSSNGAAGSQ